MSQAQNTSPISAIMPTYARADLAFERGDGAYLTATDGRRFLDFGTGIAVCALGHAHPKLVGALQGQAEKLWHVSNLYQSPGGERVAQTLIDNSFADTVLFCNSGAEALEGSVKVARKYQSAIGHPERYRVICCDGAFHGRTLAMISATGNPKMLDGFGPRVDGFDHVPFGNMNEVRAAIGSETAAILVEPVQGEGGIIPARLDFLRDLRAACDEYGLLLIFDEVQCGMGRTGKLYAHEWSDITPDVLASAKGLGGGFPVGAVLATADAAQGMVPGTHGTTYGGNALAMAVTEALLTELLGDGFLDEVDRVARILWHRLLELQARHGGLIDEVRGAGLMLGLRLNDSVPAMNLVNALYGENMLTVPAGDNTVRLLPPLIIGEAEIDEALTKLDAALTTLSSTLEAAA